MSFDVIIYCRATCPQTLPLITSSSWIKQGLCGALPPQSRLFLFSLTSHNLKSILKQRSLKANIWETSQSHHQSYIKSWALLLFHHVTYVFLLKASFPEDSISIRVIYVEITPTHRSERQNVLLLEGNHPIMAHSWLSVGGSPHNSTFIYVPTVCCYIIKKQKQAASMNIGKVLCDQIQHIKIAMIKHVLVNFVWGWGITGNCMQREGLSTHKPTRACQQYLHINWKPTKSWIAYLASEPWKEKRNSQWLVKGSGCYGDPMKVMVLWHVLSSHETRFP